MWERLSSSPAMQGVVGLGRASLNRDAMEASPGENGLGDPSSQEVNDRPTAATG